MKRDDASDIVWCAAFADAHTFVAPEHGMEGIVV